MLAALITALIFLISRNEARAIAYVLSTGGVFGLVAAWLALHLDKKDASKDAKFIPMQYT